jgi:hypothetical protein
LKQRLELAVLRGRRESDITATGVMPYGDNKDAAGRFRAALEAFQTCISFKTGNWQEDFEAGNRQKLPLGK